MACAVGHFAAIALVIASLLCCSHAFERQSATRRLLAPGDLWPVAKCNHALDKSPLRLIAADPAVDGVYNKFCFTVVDNGICDSTSPCCNKTLGVHKVAFQVDAACKSSVKKVTIDGMQDFGYEFNVADKTLKITGINSPTAGQEICVFVKQDSVCRTRSQLFPTCTYSIFTMDCDCCPVGNFCPPPPPPPSPPDLDEILPPPPPAPPRAFPNCSCITDAPTQYTVIQPAVFAPNVAPGVSRVCFALNTLSLPSCSKDNICCDFDLHKIEINVPASCASSFVYATVGTKKTGWFQTKPYPAIKASALKIPFGNVDKTQVCLYLRPPCATLSSLCPGGTCQVAVYNDAGAPASQKTSCCPVLPVSFPFDG